MSRIEAQSRNARALRFVRSQSLARRRQRLVDVYVDGNGALDNPPLRQDDELAGVASPDDLDVDMSADQVQFLPEFRSR